MPSAPPVLLVTSEIYPFSKTGGLGDVLGALPAALARQGLNVAVVTPLYGRMSTGGHPIHLVRPGVPVGYPWAPITCDVYMANFQGVPVYFIDRAEFFDRRYYYCTHHGDYFDNCERFVFLARAALAWARRLETPPAVIHLHDWQTAVAAAFLHFARPKDPLLADTRCVLTIHNLAFQGRFASRLFENSGLPWEAWGMDGVEFYGDFNLLKAGIAYADCITTVSPGYAREIVTPEFGCGLEGILGRRKGCLHGILNGADYEVWDPGSDRYLPMPYGPGSLAGKQVCKEHLIAAYDLDPALAKRPILGFIGRLRRQKGIDLVLAAMDELMRLNVGLVVLGEGNLEFEARLADMAERYPGRVWAHIGYTEEMAHYIQAGTDIFLMPSRYEPCGLTQMYALRFGTPPVATAVGGLRDTIVPHPAPGATGFTFDAPDPARLVEAVGRAVAVWEDAPAWQALQERGMRTAFSWDDSAQGYLDVYRSLGAKI